ncbi:type II toxin-antitoxin system prevent-host-death family antitoxin [Amycolatopsis sp. NPDC004378]
MSEEPQRLPDVGSVQDVPAPDARKRMPELLEDVRAGGIVYLTKYDRRIAALVPAEMAENIERIEDDYWSRRAAQARTDAGDTVPWDQAVAELEGRGR